MKNRKSLISLIICSLLMLTFMSQAVFAATISSGTSLAIKDVSKSIKAFNNQLSIKFPAGEAIINSEGALASDQGVNTTVYFSGGSEGKYSSVSSDVYQSYSIASNVFEISVSEATYQFLYPAQLTIKYNDNITSTMADQLSIWYSDKPDFKSETLINLGGISNPSSKTITVPISGLMVGKDDLNNKYNGYFAVFLSHGQFLEFQDNTDPSGWAYSAVMPLWSKGIMEPLPKEESPTKFGLDRQINRLEFTTMIVKSLGLKLVFSDTNMFSDRLKFSYENLTEPTIYGDYYQIYKENENDRYHIYSREDSYYPSSPSLFVKEAAKNGFINGYGDATFRPQNSITRQEAAAILARTANLKLEDDYDKVDTQLAKLFTDYDSISSWARPAVLAAAKAKLIIGEKDVSDTKGKSYKFNPNGNTTRAEAATLIYRLVKKLKKL